MKIKAKKEPVHRCLVTKKFTIFIVQNLNAVPQPTLTHVMQTNRPRRHTPERLIQVDGFYEKSPPLHYELVKVCVFYGGRRRRWISYIRRDLASTQRKNEKKQAWRANCAAPILCYEEKSKGNILLYIPGSQTWSRFVRGDLRTAFKTWGCWISLGSFVFAGVYPLRQDGGRGGEEV